MTMDVPAGMDVGFGVWVPVSERAEFSEWARREVAARWEIGRRRYHRESDDFQGCPIQHTMEETFDQVVYLWVERRRLAALEADDPEGRLALAFVYPVTSRGRSWRQMSRESEAECLEWLDAELSARMENRRVSMPSSGRWALYDRGVFHALGMLAALWAMKREAEAVGG